MRDAKYPAWVPKVFLARFPVSVMSVSEVFPSAVREKTPLVPREDAKENSEEKNGRANSWGSRRGHFFYLTALFRVTQDGLSERGNIRSLMSLLDLPDTKKTVILASVRYNVKENMLISSCIATKRKKKQATI